MREFQALELRKQGASYDQIAHAMNTGKDYAYKLVIRGLKRIDTKMREGLDEMVRLEVERLDAMLRAVWTKAREGDLKAVDRVLRIMQRRADLLGLDAPKRQHIDLTMTHEQIIDMLE